MHLLQELPSGTPDGKQGRWIELSWQVLMSTRLPLCPPSTFSLFYADSRNGTFMPCHPGMSSLGGLMALRPVYGSCGW